VPDRRRALADRQDQAYLKVQPVRDATMTEIAASDRSAPRILIAVAGLFGVLLAAAVALWGYYGTAVFTEMILAGLAACF
jgi:hypothetical protein